MTITEIKFIRLYGHLNSECQCKSKGEYPMLKTVPFIHALGVKSYQENSFPVSKHSVPPHLDKISSIVHRRIKYYVKETAYVKGKGFILQLYCKQKPY